MWSTVIIASVAAEMKSSLFSICAAVATLSTASAAIVKRADFNTGEPYDPKTGKGAPILGSLQHNASNCF